MCTLRVHRYIQGSLDGKGWEIHMLGTCAVNKLLIWLILKSIEYFVL